MIIKSIYLLNDGALRAWRFHGGGYMRGVKLVFFDFYAKKFIDERESLKTVGFHISSWASHLFAHGSSGLGGI